MKPLYRIVINLDDIPITNYHLKISTGSLSGRYDAESLLDDAIISPLTANASGGFDAYAPETEIPPYGIFVIQLIPA